MLKIIISPAKKMVTDPDSLECTGLPYFVDKAEYLKNILKSKNYAELKITSIAFPPLGCGNGGLSWEIVGPIMYNKLKNLPNTHPC